MSDIFRFRVYSIAFFVIGLGVIVTAWGFQLIGGYEPCPLCLQQRTPYYVALPIALCGLFISSLIEEQFYAKLLLLLAGFVMVYGAWLGFYHSGVEWGFWEGPAECAGGGAIVEKAIDLKAALQNTRVISCTDAAWRMFGLSFAGWNVVASCGLALITFLGVKTVSEKKKR